MKLLIGLGNPDKDYAHTRHNIGWDAVSAWADKQGMRFQEKSRFQAELAEGRLGQDKLILVKPLTYMNLSGQTVQALIDFYKLDLADLLLIHDEMDYPLGRLAFCEAGGPAGHNGVRSVQDRLGTEKIARLRLGIGRPLGRIAKEDYVLERFSEEEAALLPTLFTRAGEAMEDWCARGIGPAMNTWNTRPAASSS